VNVSVSSHSQRLSVIWFVDLVGHSTLAARDHDRALDQIQRFQEVVRRIVADEDGRVVKFLGDGALLESSSALAAVEAAGRIHAEMGDELRTGIHLGDVAVGDDGDLYGEGVNGAQRIQTEAEPGQIVVSEDVWRRLRNRPAYAFESLGERPLKGIEPMELFALIAIDRRETGARTRETAGRARAGERIAEEPVPPSIAVLPFANLSPDPENEYFSDGVTEEILTLLARVEGLKVISRTSVMRYKGTVKPIREIGRELGVTSILEGSVRRAGQRVRITAQLIDAATDDHLWADRYDRDLEDIFAIQAEVSERIVEALRLRLTTGERTRLARKPTGSLEAYESYLKGRHSLSRRTGPALEQAIDHFRKAVAADPGFSEAWVGLADGLILLTEYAATPVDQVIDEARAAGERALALDPRLGEAHVSLGYIAQSAFRWAEAERHFRRGLELSPGYVTGYHWFALLQGQLGRFEEGIALLRRAEALDPLSLPVRVALGTLLHRAGRLEEALEVYRKALELDPGHAALHNNLAETYKILGRYEEALAEMETCSRIAPEYMPAGWVADLGAGFESGGERGFWEAALRSAAENQAQRGPATHFDMAEACVRLGRPSEAFEHLEDLVRTRHPIAADVLNELSVAPLRSDPRFESLKRELGMP
jgi:TolB-like protein/class 3 adenylate cyclase/Flp pilus assembly protein TadD